MNKVFKSGIFLLLLMIVISYPVNSAEIDDISQDHWAYNSVKTLIDKGYLSLYEDGTFKGNNKVSRYELAVIIARMLDDIETRGTEVTDEDAEKLRKLSLEFRDELVEVAKNQDEIFKRIETNKEKNVVQTDSIGKNREKINNIDKEISNIIDNIVELKNLSEEVDNLYNEVDGQSVTIKNLKEQLNSNQDTINKINEQLENINNEVGSQKAINDLKDQQSVTVTNVHNLKKRVNSLNDKVGEQEETINQLKKENNQYKMYFIGLAVLTLASF